MQNGDGNAVSSKKFNKGIVHIKNDSNKDESYYPQECYIEDFELEKIKTMQILENFKPVDADN
ncbi:hypothetical protein MOV66_00385 [Agrobacterium sp. SHOUNA12C]|jgi:hypothetical protein|nr:hypothetical protein [Agrobacterium sp. BETTINA12B]MCJ9755095.1 hypothetical protein [Agrobacterium sp. SHOUNA12C]